MKIYHYTQADHWPSIQRGSKNGLLASRRMGTEYSKAINTPAVYCLLEPLPASWTNNPILGNVLSRLRDDSGNILINIDTEEYPGKVLVADRAHIQVFLNEVEDAPSQYLHDSREAAEKAYVESLIDLEEYLNNPNVFNLPEVVIPKTIPKKYLHISKSQPLLEDDLNRIKRVESLQREVAGYKVRVPELSRWLDEYIQKKSIKEVQVGFLS